MEHAAHEAGISTRAFDAALAETREPFTPPKRSLLDSAVTNVLAFGGFWVVAGALSRIAGSLALGWPAHHGLMIGANLLGFGIAVRLRARVTAVLLGATAALQAAEYPIHLLFGIQTVQGGETKWALLLAGLLGIGFGAVIVRRRRADDGGPAADAGIVQPSSSPPTPSALEMLLASWRRFRLDRPNPIGAAPS